MELQLEPEPAYQYIGSRPADYVRFLRRYLPSDLKIEVRGYRKPKLDLSRELPFTINFTAGGGLRLVGKTQTRFELGCELCCIQQATPAIVAALTAVKYVEENFADTLDVLPGLISHKLVSQGFDTIDADSAIDIITGSGCVAWFNWVKEKNWPVWYKKVTAAHDRMLDVRREIETAVHGESHALCAGEVLRDARQTGTASLDEQAWVLWHFHRPVIGRSRFPAKITLRIPDTGLIEVQGLDPYSREFKTVKNVESLLKQLNVGSESRS